MFCHCPQYSYFWGCSNGTVMQGFMSHTFFKGSRISISFVSTSSSCEEETIQVACFATSAPIYRSLRALRARNRKSLTKSLFRGSAKKSSKISKRSHKKPRLDFWVFFETSWGIPGGGCISPCPSGGGGGCKTSF